MASSFLYPLSTQVRYLFNQSLGCVMRLYAYMHAILLFVVSRSPSLLWGDTKPERLSPKFRVPCLGLLRKATGEELEGAGLLPAGLPRPTRVRGIRTWEEHALANLKPPATFKYEAGCNKTLQMAGQQVCRSCPASDRSSGSGFTTRASGFSIVLAAGYSRTCA